MGTSSFVEDFKEGLEFVPVDGKPNLFFIHTRGLKTGAALEPEMTDEDWNEFERHVSEAFEQIP